MSSIMSTNMSTIVQRCTFREQAAILGSMAQQDSSFELQPVAYMRPRGGCCRLRMSEEFTPLPVPKPSLLLTNLPINGSTRPPVDGDSDADSDQAGKRAHCHTRVSIEGLNELPHSKVDGEPHEWPRLGTTADGRPAYLSTY